MQPSLDSLLDTQCRGCSASHQPLPIFNLQGRASCSAVRRYEAALSLVCGLLCSVCVHLPRSEYHNLFHCSYSGGVLNSGVNPPARGQHHSLTSDSTALQQAGKSWPHLVRRPMRVTMNLRLLACPGCAPSLPLSSHLCSQRKGMFVWAAPFQLHLLARSKDQARLALAALRASAIATFPAKTSASASTNRGSSSSDSSAL